MEYTSKYHLPQWVESDRIMMEDFNQMCRDVEAGLESVKSESGTAVNSLMELIGSGGQNARVTWGSYVGNGTFGDGVETRLEFDIHPVVVFIGNDVNVSQPAWPSILLRGVDSTKSDYEQLPCHVEWGDKSVSLSRGVSAERQNNVEGWTYYYVAIGY